MGRPAPSGPGCTDGPALPIIPARPVPQLLAPDGARYGLIVLPPRREYGMLGLPETRLAVLLLALAATGIASWLLTRSISRPVRALGAATRDLARGNLDIQLDPAVSARRDELGTLGRDFDAMALRLRDLLQGRERLLRDVSHELRSPLARMRVALGLARQPGGDVGRQIERIEQEIERLDRLIGQVLHLSRLDAHSGTAFDEPVDLVELLDDIARDAAFEAQARAVDVDWTPPAAPAHGARQRGVAGERDRERRPQRAARTPRPTARSRSAQRRWRARNASWSATTARACRRRSWRGSSSRSIASPNRAPATAAATASGSRSPRG